MFRTYALLGAAVALGLLTTPSAQSRNNTRGGGMLLVANKGAHSLGVIDTEKNQQIADIPEGGITGHEVIASPDGSMAYVPIYGNSGVGKPGTDGQQIVAIDLKQHKVVKTLDFDHAVRPHCPMFGPKNGLLYVTTELDKTVSIIDPHSFKVIGAIPTGQEESHMLAISHDGKRGYTANVGPGTVSVLDMNAHKTLAVIPISKQTQRISVSQDDSMVFTSDQTKPQLAVIDTKTNKVKTWVELPGLGYGTASTKDGRFLVVAVSTVDKVAVVDLNSMKVVHTIDVPKAPQEVLISPDGETAYVSCDSSKKVAAIRTSDWTVASMIDAGKGADGLAWAR